MEKILNGFIEYDGERTDLKECKHIIAAINVNSGVRCVAHGELNMIEMAQAIYSLNKTIEKILKSHPGLREAVKLIEAIENETQD